MSRRPLYTFAILLLCAFLATAQKRSPWDIVLDPIHPTTPTAYSAESGGNWANKYLEINQHAQHVQDNAARKVAVFVFDTGGAWDHPGLARAAWNNYGRTFTGEASPADGHGHSTHVAGIIAGQHSAYDLGVARHLAEIGMLKIIPIKVLTNQGSGQISWIIAAMDYANSVSATLMAQGWFCIYNFSLGAGGIHDALNAAMQQAENLGIYIVAAAGNTGTEGISSPANSRSAHAIAALDPTGARASYSSTGPEMYGAAPGSNILSTWPGGGLREASGTSMAAPAFAAVVAIVASLNPTATNRQISHYMAKQATDIAPFGHDNRTGYGAPLLTRLLAGDPAKEPNTGNGNPAPPTTTPPPTKERRTVMLTLPDVYRVLWRRNTETTPGWNVAYVVYTIETTTNLYAHDVYDIATEDTRRFFTNRAFILTSTADFLDAGHWSRHFYEMILKQQGKDYKVTALHVSDAEGRNGPVARPAALALKKRIRPASVRTMTGAWIQP